MGNNTNLLDWDGVLNSDGIDTLILPEGDYEFEVTTFERGTFPGSTKLEACNKASLTLAVIAEDGTVAQIHDDLLLHQKMMWKLSAFFRSIGLKKLGEDFTMDWSKVRGARGRAKVIVQTYTDKSGKERKINHIDMYLDYDPSKMRPVNEATKDGFLIGGAW